MRRSAIVTAVITGTLLLVPLIAMHFTDEVSWGPGDFLAAGFLLFGAGMGVVVAARQTRTTPARVAVVACIAASLLVVWAELAVGLFT